MLVPVLLALAGCGGETEANESAEAESNLAGEVPEDAVVLAQDPELANEAAADEAADMETFGGNAAAMGANRQ